MGDPTAELEQYIFETVLDLSRVDIISLFGDICTFHGWYTEMGIGDTDVIGDLLAIQEFPIHQSVSVYCYDDELTQSQLKQDFELFGNAESTAMVALIQRPASGEAVVFAEEHNVTIVDPTDITTQLLQLATPELLSDYVDPEEFETKFDDYQSDIEKTAKESVIGSDLDFTPSAKTEDGVTAGILGVAYDVDVTTILGPYVDNKNVSGTVVLWEVVNDMDVSIDGDWETNYVLDNGMETDVLNLALSDTWADDQWKVAGSRADDVPETHPATRTRWIDVVNIPEGKELDTAIIHSGYSDRSILIRLSITEAQIISAEALPF